MRIAALALLVGLLLPSLARADAVVVARATEERGGSWVACGRVHAVGWVVYDLVKVIEGDSPGARFVGVHSCPSRERLQGELRLVLRTTKSPLQPALPPRSAPADLPHFYVHRESPEAPEVTRGARRLLGQPRVTVEATLTPTGKDADWIQYGPDLALRYVGDQVVALRARVALGMSCVEAAAWLGWVAGRGRGFPMRRRDSCEWPGLSERHRLQAGVAGRLRAGWFDAWTR